MIAELEKKNLRVTTVQYERNIYLNLIFCLPKVGDDSYYVSNN